MVVQPVAVQQVPLQGPASQGNASSAGAPGRTSPPREHSLTGEARPPGLGEEEEVRPSLRAVHVPGHPDRSQLRGVDVDPDLLAQLARRGGGQRLGVLDVPTGQAPAAVAVGDPVASGEQDVAVVPAQHRPGDQVVRDLSSAGSIGGIGEIGTIGEPPVMKTLSQRFCCTATKPGNRP